MCACVCVCMSATAAVDTNRVRWQSLAKISQYTRANTRASQSIVAILSRLTKNYGTMCDLVCAPDILRVCTFTHTHTHTDAGTEQTDCSTPTPARQRRVVPIEVYLFCIKGIHRCCAAHILMWEQYAQWETRLGQRLWSGINAIIVCFLFGSFGSRTCNMFSICCIIVIHITASH